MTVKIGITNQKGGVAKTTNTINIAGALADRGLDVLAVDADPQGYLTHRLGFEDAYLAEEDSFYEAFKDPSSYDVHDLVVQHAEFDLLPSNIDMFHLEQDLIAAGMKPRLRLQMLFEDVDEWDAIVVDAPPSLGPINDNVVLATGQLLVPVEADASSQLAVNHLLRQLDTLEDNYGTRIDILGLIVSNVDYPLDNEQRDAIEWFESRFGEHIPVHVIRRRVAIKRAVDAGQSLFGDGVDDCDMRDVYATIAAEVADA
ncbi:chromosome partitioning protein [Halopelagius inordinatus]|uniref:Chromosome partitioning protein n=1 Tax=Halopelagius inordinatus TaxID=553467 RepID=A0A1I2WYD0_9EURY|nr:ParA family protein [Halopelagius inordinatus]SFH05446.1 chromosome partitioning protein [Halopelagius inordinatus]